MLPSKYVIFPIKKKFLKRNDSRTAVIFQALKMKCSLVICRIAINKKCHSFKLLDYLSLCPIGFHEQDWLLAMTLQKRHFCKDWHRLFNACWGTSALVSFMCVSLHGQNLLCWTLGYIMSTMISCWLSLFVKKKRSFNLFNFPRALLLHP